MDNIILFNMLGILHTKSIFIKKKRIRSLPCEMGSNSYQSLDGSATRKRSSETCVIVSPLLSNSWHCQCSTFNCTLLLYICHSLTIKCKLSFLLNCCHYVTFNTSLLLESCHGITIIRTLLLKGCFLGE